MGSSASSEQPPVNQNRQSNGNQFWNIDQSTGIICVLLVALWVALRYNRKANKKARRAELHELLLLSSRHQRNHDYYKEHSTPLRPSSGYPGMSSVLSPPVHVREHGYEGYPGFLAWQQLQHQAQYPQYPAISSGLPSGLSSGVSSLPTVHQPADWSRIREIPGTPSRTRVSYAVPTEHQRRQPRHAAPSVSASGPPATAEPTLFEPQPRGLAYPPEAVASIVERLDTLTLQ